MHYSIMKYSPSEHEYSTKHAIEIYNKSEKLGLKFVILEGKHYFVQEAIRLHVQNGYQLVASGACSVESNSYEYELLHWAHLKK